MKYAILLTILLSSKLFSQSKFDTAGVLRNAGVYHNDDYIITPHWIMVGETAETGKVFYYSHYISRRNLTVIKIWSKWDGASYILKGKTFKGGEIMMLYEIECKSGAFRIIQKTIRDKIGKVVIDKSYDDEDWSYPIPDTIGYSLVDTISNAFFRGSLKEKE